MPEIAKKILIPMEIYVNGEPLSPLMNSILGWVLIIALARGLTDFIRALIP